MFKNKVSVTGLGYGDEGKGTITEFMCSELNATEVIRHCGGPQNRHYILNNDQVHGFCQFGSGTLHNHDLRTYLSKNVFVDPYSILEEAQKLDYLGVREPFKLMNIHEDCLIVTPLHKAVNQLRELTRYKRHGSCGYGVGECMMHEEFVLWNGSITQYKDFDDIHKTVGTMYEYYQLKKYEIEELLDKADSNSLRTHVFKDIFKYKTIVKFADFYTEFYKNSGIVSTPDYEFDLLESSKKRIVYEGSQGVLLDRKYGFFPHVTPSYTTNRNIKIEDERITKIGVLRAYHTRHGAGPFVTEDNSMGLTEMHNETKEFNGEFRTGWFDCVAAKYALSFNRDIDYIALTCLDRLEELFSDKGPGHIKICTNYIYRGCNGNVNNYLEFDSDGIVCGIKEPALYSLQSMEELTSVLDDCEPLYKDYSGISIDEYTQIIQEQLGKPIVITSLGPELKDKALCQK